jgi:RNA polymerase sigma-70 factor (ECF subfamily)
VRAPLPTDPVAARQAAAADATLMQAVARGDAAAQRTFVERTAPRVRRATGALLRDHADADDAAQLCMLELLRGAGAFRGDGALESWCDRIVVRTAMRFAKKQARSRHLVDVVADPERLSAPSTDPRRRDEIASDVRAYLDSLPPARREALVLRHVLDHSVEEIAAITGVSSNTVKDRLVTARREFRKMLRRERVIEVVAAHTGNKPDRRSA